MSLFLCLPPPTAMPTYSFSRSLTHSHALFVSLSFLCLLAFFHHILRLYMRYFISFVRVIITGGRFRICITKRQTIYQSEVALADRSFSLISFATICEVDVCIPNTSTPSTNWLIPGEYDQQYQQELEFKSHDADVLLVSVSTNNTMWQPSRIGWFILSSVCHF